MVLDSSPSTSTSNFSTFPAKLHCFLITIELLTRKKWQSTLSFCKKWFILFFSSKEPFFLLFNWVLSVKFDWLGPNMPSNFWNFKIHELFWLKTNHRHVSSGIREGFRQSCDIPSRRTHSSFWRRIETKRTWKWSKKWGLDWWSWLRVVPNSRTPDWASGDSEWHFCFLLPDFLRHGVQQNQTQRLLEPL